MDKLLLVTMPLTSIPAGAFIRSSRILPYLAKLAYRSGLEPVVYIPYTLLLRTTGFCSRHIESVLSELERIGEMYRGNALLVRKLLEKRWGCGGGLGETMNFSTLPLHVYVAMARRIESMVSTVFYKLLGSGGTEYIYCMHENLEALIAYDILLSVSGNPRSAVMLQSVLEPGISLGMPLTLYKSLNARMYAWTSLRIIKEAAEKGSLKLVTGISPVVFNPYFIREVGRKGVSLKTPRPSNAVDPEIIKYRKLRDKESSAVYFGRLSKEKGLLDLLKAWEIIAEERRDVTLYLIGKFKSKRDYRLYRRYVEQHGLRRVYYLGSIPQGGRLWRLLSGIKILLYPSYTDTFSLTILEALSLGLFTIAYDIPAVRYLYRDLPVVARVSIGDYEAMAEKAVEVLNLRDDEFRGLFETDIVTKFINGHSSWKRVAEAEWSILEGSLIR